MVRRLISILAALCAFALAAASAQREVFPEDAGTGARACRVLEESGKWRLEDGDGNALTEDVYDTMSAFSDGASVVSRGGLFGFLGADGREILSPCIKEMGKFENGRAVCAFEDGKRGVVRRDGTAAVEPAWEDIEPVSTGRGYVAWTGGKACLLSAEGEELCPAAFDSISTDFSNGSAVVRLGGGRGLIGEDGKLVLEPFYDWVYTEEGTGLFTAVQRYEGGARQTSVVVDARGRVLYTDVEIYGITGGAGAYTLREGDGKPMIVLPDGGRIGPFDDVDTDFVFQDGVFIVKEGGGWTAVSRDGKAVLKDRYEDLGPVRCGLACAKKDGAYGYVDPDGNEVIPFRYSYADDFEECGFACVASGGRDGAIDTKGNEALPCAYRSVVISPDGTAEVRKEEGGYAAVDLHTGKEILTVASGFNKSDYLPGGKKLADLGEEAAVKLERDPGRRGGDFNVDGLPRLDGATGSLPVYSVLFRELYPDDLTQAERDILFRCSKTAEAYQNLIDGNADIIFCLEPSQDELRAAREKGVSFRMVPFGREAFVFTVHPDNPLDGLTLDEVRGIYTGAITRWDELGAEGLGDIVAYQREENSGSQTTMQALMRGYPMMDPPMEWVSDGMADILATIEYRNLPDAIGYTFRFFCSEMAGSGLKLLRLNGAEPDKEHIASGEYPVVSTLYAVTLEGNEDPNVKAVLDWITSEQGQRLVEKAGYVPYTAPSGE